MPDKQAISRPDDDDAIVYCALHQDPASLIVVTETLNAHDEFEIVNPDGDPAGPYVELECGPDVIVFKDGHGEAEYVSVAIIEWEADHDGREGRKGTGPAVRLSPDSAEAVGRALIESARRVRSGEAVQSAEQLHIDWAEEE